MYVDTAELTRYCHQIKR